MIGNFSAADGRSACSALHVTDAALICVIHITGSLNLIGRCIRMTTSGRVKGNKILVPTILGEFFGLAEQEPNV